MKEVWLPVVLIILNIFSNISLFAQESKSKLYRIYISEPSEIKKIANQGFDIYYLQPENTLRF